MAAAQRQNTPTEQNKEDYALIQYRLQAVETAVNTLTSRFDKLDNISKSDLKELQVSLKETVTGFTTSMQKQIDEKADKSSVDDLKTRVNAAYAFFTSIITAMIIYYLTRSR